MTNPTETELETIAETRARYFTPRWFFDLFAARLGFGDTFWIGNLGTLIFIVPLAVLGSMFAAIISEQLLEVFYKSVAGLLAVYRLGVAQAVLRTGVKSAAPLGWRITGIALTLLWAGAEIMVALGRFGG
jgi:hypothetical protein